MICEIALERQAFKSSHFDIGDFMEMTIIKYIVEKIILQIRTVKLFIEHINNKILYV